MFSSYKSEITWKTYHLSIEDNQQDWEQVFEKGKPI